MEATWNTWRWVIILWFVPLLLGYYYAWRDITSRWEIMQARRKGRLWFCCGLVGLITTLLAIGHVIHNGVDIYGCVGIFLYFIGELAWPYIIVLAPAYEPKALFITSFGLVLWATATTSEDPMWTLPVVISALYHVVVDLCWYMSFHATYRDYNSLDTTTAKFASWSGYLAMLHYAFASFIAIETIRATTAFSPDIRLTYNRWLRDDNADSCADSDCVVFPVYTTYGAVNIGFVVAMFSWLSGTNHAITYIGLHSQWQFVVDQVGLGDNKHYGNVIRTVDWALSASLMMAVNLFLYETPGNITSLMATMAATGLVMIVGWSSELLHGLGEGWVIAKWIVFAGASVLFTLLWVPLLWILSILNQRPDRERYEINGMYTSDALQSPPIEVYFFIGWLMATFFMFPVVQWFKLWGLPNTTRSFKYEIWFAILSFWSKIPLLAVFYGGILSRRNTIESDKYVNMTDVSTTSAPEDASSVFQSIGIGISISFVSAIVMIIGFRSELGCKPTCGGTALSDAKSVEMALL